MYTDTKEKKAELWKLKLTGLSLEDVEDLF
jgi:hypothetical protein